MTYHTTWEDRARGALVGLAVGDAVGTTLEFTPASDPFTPRVTDIVGGGPFHLPSGGHTDDTSMAMCLSASLIKRQGMDLRDQMNHYVRWWQEGLYSVKGYCFDIGGATAQALAAYTAHGNPVAGGADAAGNGALMRLAPVVIAAPTLAIAQRWAVRQTGTTHGHPAARDASHQFATRLWRAIHNVGDPLSPIWRDNVSRADADTRRVSRADISREARMAGIANASWERAAGDATGIRGTGFVVDALEAALWSVSQANLGAGMGKGLFADAVILAANLGEDSDSTAAIAGQLAGAIVGYQGIPRAWRNVVYWRDDLVAMADRLIALNGTLCAAIDAGVIDAAAI